MSRRVTLAYDLNHDGKQHKADSTVTLPDEVAIELLHYGRARKPEQPKVAPAPKAEISKENKS